MKRLSTDTKKRIAKDIKDGISMGDIVKKYGVSLSTVSRISKMKLDEQPKNIERKDITVGLIADRHDFPEDIIKGKYIFDAALKDVFNFSYMNTKINNFIESNVLIYDDNKNVIGSNNLVVYIYLVLPWLQLR